jgi:regulator of protease activity HflC (stomatin/prohibitin superfamily)
VSTRIRNQESAQAKVNDADGNPIEIAAVVVWLVRDTASALYSVDDFTQFVTIQTETAVRHIASSYPYDNRGSGALSLRDNAAEITQQLSAEIADRVRSAGVEIIESRLTRQMRPRGRPPAGRAAETSRRLPQRFMMNGLVQQPSRKSMTRRCSSAAASSS